MSTIKPKSHIEIALESIKVFLDDGTLDRSRRSFANPVFEIPSARKPWVMSSDDDEPDADDRCMILADEDLPSPTISKDQPLSFGANYDADELRCVTELHRMLDTSYAVAVGACSADSEWTVFALDYGGERILILDSKLQLMRTLEADSLRTASGEQVCEPRQLWFDKPSGRLYVGQDTGAVDAFRIVSSDDDERRRQRRLLSRAGRSVVRRAE